jgi:hypothetical protein
MVPSKMLSPICGMMTSTDIGLSCAHKIRSLDDKIQ